MLKQSYSRGFPVEMVEADLQQINFCKYGSEL